MTNFLGNGANTAVHALRVLLVEDNPSDAVLSERLVTNAYPHARCDVVQTLEEFSRKIRTTYFDVVLSDYALGSGNGVDAFKLMQEVGRDVPFILVTGALDDTRALECVNSGITDYILKDHPDRLPLAISRALEEKELLVEHTRAEHMLRDSEASFRMLADAIAAATFIEQDARCSYANHPAERVTGYDRKELVRMSFWGMVAPESRNSVIEKLAHRVDKEYATSRYELRIQTKQREARWLDVTIGVFQGKGRSGSLITAFDISNRKRQEQEVLKVDLERLSHLELPVSRTLANP